MDKLFIRDEHGNLRLYDFGIEDELTGPSLTMGEVADLAIARGALGTFDWALPQGWVDDVYHVTGEYPFGFVWSYPERSIWGEPFPLTTKARDLLARYTTAKEATRG